MSTVMPSPSDNPSANPFVCSMNTVRAGRTQPIEWLLIAHDEPGLLASLKEAVVG